MSIHRILAALSLLGIFSGDLQGQPALTGKVSGGFQAPTSTDSDGRRHVVRGKDMEARGDGVLELTEPRVTRYNPDDSPDMFIESAHCVYNTKAGTAFSPTNLLVRTADGRFAIQGLGWHWDLSASLLTISNKVEAQVQKAVLADPKASTVRANRETNQVVHITARSFQQEGDQAAFSGSVLVKDGDDTLRCERLIVQFVKPGGAQKIEAIQNVDLVQADTRIQSGRAVYDVKDNLIRLSEEPKWVSGQREGSANELLIDRNTETLAADGAVYMKLPLTNLVLGVESSKTNQTISTQRFFEIRADHFKYTSGQSNRTTEAVYTGHVRAMQADAVLSCEKLIANFGAGNRLMHLQAVGKVEIASPQNSVSGDRADYEVEENKMVVTGDPRWKVDQMSGRSGRLVFYAATKEVLASEGVEMLVPGRSLGGVFSIGEPVATNSTLKITAEALSHSARSSVFQRNVLVADARGTIGCDSLMLVAGQSNQVQRIVAEKNVVIKQPDMVAFGDRAEYERATGLVRLTGDPELLAPGKSLHAKTFIIDRNRNTFSVSPGKYRIQLQLSDLEQPSRDQ